MKCLCILCFAISLHAAQGEPSKPVEKSAAPPAAALAEQAHSTMLIEPKTRALDFVQAFELLHKDKPTQKINVQTSMGILMNVMEMSAADSGTLLFIKIPSNQGTKYAIVPVEDVQEIAYSP